MFKEFLVLAISALCLTQAFTETHTADMEFLHKQKKIYDLFFYVDQYKLEGSEWYEVGKSYDISANMEMYNDKMVVREFLYRFKLGFLRRGALFSVFYEEHREELRILFKLFYTAKDFSTFYKTACWCRHYMNQGMFITALSTAVMYRPDCKYIVLPPMYEVYPHLFFDNEVIQEAHKYMMSHGYKQFSGEHGYDTYVIDYNSTASFMKYFMDPEYKLYYFTEDVGLNNYYYYIRSLFPFWITIKDLELPKHIRGELYYYVHQQLMARYYLERLSNGFGEIEDFSFYKSFAPGYYSSLVYGNGVSVPSREPYSFVPYYKYKYVKEAENIESRILAAIDSGYVYDYEGKKYELYSPEGIELLGNIIEGNYDSCNPRFYGAIDALYRDIFGFNYDCKSKHCFVPSALQFYSTSLRDPAFYYLYKRIIGYFYRYKCNLPSYSHSELEFPGVYIEDVKVEKLYTFMEPYDYFINNAVTVDSYKSGMNFDIKVKKYRLNYKPFTYYFNIKSDKATKGMVRIFLGPSYDDYYFKEPNYFYYNWYEFVELDKFSVDLKPGMNTIERLSTDSYYTAKDFVGSDYFYKKLLKSIGGSEPFTYSGKYYGFPNNLYLPKGKAGGMPYKLFVFVYPFEESKMTTFDFPLFGKMFYDGKPFGFPLDRPMYPWYYDLSNMYFKDVYIYHNDDYYGDYYQHEYSYKPAYKEFSYKDYKNYKDYPYEKSAPFEHKYEHKYEPKYEHKYEGGEKPYYFNSHKSHMY
ncbi:LOW QUALITY PROTEIN: arylphorin subunit alpha [Chelonus insularis]|uniref:LOW QUALITY PROTEIN: arylphorin subunit alpha n=1 Tax=Chelonus insularis TaxID=460826 RepID=UPI001589EB77|nr:LOW QUALITY PROTEIN: arylphorin subunit alpha-like [Chelonus insularis]